MNINPQKYVVELDKQGKVVRSVPYGERHARTKEQAIAILGAPALKEFEFYESTMSFQRKIIIRRK